MLAKILQFLRISIAPRYRRVKACAERAAIFALAGCKRGCGKTNLRRKLPGRDYKAFASSSAKALCGPPTPVRFTALFFVRRGRSNTATAVCGGGPAKLDALTGGFDAEGGGPLAPDRPPGPCGGPCGEDGPLDLGGCAGLARSKRSSRGARSNRRIMECISSAFGASINAKPFDSCVSGLRITLIASATRLSALSQPLISSAVTQTGRLPRNTVKLIRRLSSTPLVGVLRPGRRSPKALTCYHNRSESKQAAFQTRGKPLTYVSRSIRFMPSDRQYLRFIRPIESTRLETKRWKRNVAPMALCRRVLHCDPRLAS